MCIVELSLVVAALADGCCCRDCTRPTASFHSVAEEKGGAMGWRIGTGEHSINGTEGVGRGSGGGNKVY